MVRLVSSGGFHGAAQPDDGVRRCGTGVGRPGAGSRGGYAARAVAVVRLRGKGSGSPVSESVFSVCVQIAGDVGGVLDQFGRDGHVRTSHGRFGLVVTRWGACD